MKGCVRRLTETTYELFPYQHAPLVSIGLGNGLTLNMMPF